MIPSGHRRRVLLRRIRSTSNSACSRRQRWDRRRSSGDSQIRSHRHWGRGGDGRKRMEFETSFQLLRPNETVRTGSNRIDHLHCLPSDFCLRKGGGVDSEDRNPACNDSGRGDTLGSVLWVSVSAFRERPSREKSFRNRILSGLRRETQERGRRLLPRPERSAEVTCALGLFRSSHQSTCVMGHNTNKYPSNDLPAQRQRLQFACTASGWLGSALSI